MSDKKKNVTVVSPTGRITFLRNLWVSGGDKDKFSAALVLASHQDKSKLKKLMFDAAKAAGFTKADIDKIDKKTKAKVFSWGMKAVDTEDLDFCVEGDVIVNFDRNGDFGPPEVKGPNKGADGKYEDLIDGDIKAGDHCRVLISAFGWEHKGNKGVKFNFDAIQFIKEGEAYYTAPTSDDAWDENEFDVEVEAEDNSSEFDSPADEPEGSSEENWDDTEF